MNRPGTFHVERFGVRWFRLLAMVVLLFVALGVPGADNQATASLSSLSSNGNLASPYVPGVLLLRRRSGVATSDILQFETRASFARPVGRSGVEKWQVPAGSELLMAARLRDAGLTDIAEPDYIEHTTAFPNDPLYSQQYALPLINAPSAWTTTMGSPSVIVAVIDTGFDFTHPDKPINLIAGPTHTSTAAQDGCAPEGVNGPEDDYGHGTHVGGIIAAATNNGIGVAGLAPDVRLLVIKAADCTGNLADSDVAQSIDDATTLSARVINMSFGGTDPSAVISLAIQDAWNAGVILVAAAGNAGTSEQFYPAAIPNVLGIAATDGSDNVASFSNRGSYVALAAPGVSILSTVPENTPINGDGLIYYTYLSGTSMSTPFVAATAALILSVRCGLTNAQVISTLEQTAVPLGSTIPNQSTGYGRIDAGAAVQRVLATSSQAAVSTPPGLSPRSILPIVPNQGC